MSKYTNALQPEYPPSFKAPNKFKFGPNFKSGTFKFKFGAEADEQVIVYDTNHCIKVENKKNGDKIWIRVSTTRPDESVYEQWVPPIISTPYDYAPQNYFPSWGTPKVTYYLELFAHIKLCKDRAPPPTIGFRVDVQEEKEYDYGLFATHGFLPPSILPNTNGNVDNNRAVNYDKYNPISDKAIATSTGQTMKISSLVMVPISAAVAFGLAYLCMKVIKNMCYLKRG
eukprot:Pgem_evm1s4708